MNAARSRRKPNCTPLLLLGAALSACDPSSEGLPPPAQGQATAGRTLEAPPDLRVGEWWTVEVLPDLVGASYHSTLVVTGREGNRASIGIPSSEFSHDFLVLHVPILGDLDLDTFSWRVMWDDFAALRFPLEVGRTWTADFHGREVTAEVTQVEGARAWVTMVGDGERIELVYEADKGMITEFREEALSLGFRVTDHGFDFRGEVLALSGIELGLMSSPGRATAHHDGDDRLTASTIEVETGGSHGSLSLVLWNVGWEDEPGSYRIAATAPDGTRFEETFQGSDGPGPVVVRSFGHRGVNGTWRVDFERDGPAGLLVELFTYDLAHVVMGGGGP